MILKKKHKAKTTSRDGSGPVKAHIDRSREKVMATVFWEAQGFLLADSLEGQRTITRSAFQQKNVWESFTEFVSTMAMFLLIPLLRQGQVCENFDGKSLGTYLTVLTGSFRHLFANHKKIFKGHPFSIFLQLISITDMVTFSELCSFVMNLMSGIKVSLTCWRLY